MESMADTPDFHNIDHYSAIEDRSDLCICQVKRVNAMVFDV